MSERDVLIKMLHQLTEDMTSLSNQGAGYYTCKPFARRFNKLLETAKAMFAESRNLLDTFDDMEEADPKDPSEKAKTLQGIRVETGQLITLLEASQSGGEQ